MAKAPHQFVFNNTFSSRRTGLALYVEKWGRVLLSNTLFLAIFVVWWLLSPILILAAAILGIMLGKGFLYVQSWGFLATYVTAEVVGTIVCNAVTLYAIATGSMPYSPRFKALHTRVATNWCSSVAAIGHWIIGKRVFVRLPETGIRTKAPVLVVMRHVSANDVLLSPWIMGYRLGFNLRMVMKRELLWDPFIEASGTRCDNYYIDRWNKDNMELEVQGVSNLMRPPYQDADGRFKGITIYPEGTRLTAAKRDAVLASLERQGSPQLPYAQALRCTLPPRTKGLLALLKEGPGIDVLFMGHVGYEGAAEIPAILRGGIFNSPLSMRIWRVAAEDIPKDDEGKIQMILHHWKVLDQWCFDEREAQGKPDYLEQMIQSEANSQLYLK
jgi:1-acyl-sn-glycerol-3-phosphate acyltransferase